MDIYEIDERVTAMNHTQQALNVLSALVEKDPEVADMIHHLTAVRKELAYEIFRSEL